MYHQKNSKIGRGELPRKTLGIGSISEIKDFESHVYARPKNKNNY